MPTGQDWNRYDRYLLVVAHPDDAEFSSAGTIGQLTRAGKHVVIAQVTSGDKGTSDPATATSHLVTTREAEQLEAARRLGVASVDFLRQPDGELMPDLALRGHIVRSVRRHKPDVIITHDPFRPYAFHPDHRAVGLSAHDSAYPSARDPHAFPEQLADGLEPHKTAEVWYFNAEHPDLVVDITDSMELKIEALKAHFSQVGERNDVFDRVRDRAREMAEGQPFEYAESYKVVELRR
jgi:LmbE family N-acetylglucosaminyl deacetylase